MPRRGCLNVCLFACVTYGDSMVINMAWHHCRGCAPRRRYLGTGSVGVQKSNQTDNLQLSGMII